MAKGHYRAGIKVGALCSNMRWQRGHNRPLQLGTVLFAGAFFILESRYRRLPPRQSDTIQRESMHLLKQ